MPIETRGLKICKNTPVVCLTLYHYLPFEDLLYRYEAANIRLLIGGLPGTTLMLKDKIYSHLRLFIDQKSTLQINTTTKPHNEKQLL